MEDDVCRLVGGLCWCRASDTASRNGTSAGSWGWSHSRGPEWHILSQCRRDRRCMPSPQRLHAVQYTSHPVCWDPTPHLRMTSHVFSTEKSNSSISFTSTLAVGGERDLRHTCSSRCLLPLAAPRVGDPPREVRGLPDTALSLLKGHVIHVGSRSAT